MWCWSLSGSLPTDECRGHRSVWAGPAMMCFHQGSQSLSASLGCGAAGTHHCKFPSCWWSFQVLLRAWKIPAAVLSKCNSPHVCVSLTAEGQGRTLKAIQLFLAPGCAGEITLPKMHSCAKGWIIWCISLETVCVWWSCTASGLCHWEDCMLSMQH